MRYRKIGTSLAVVGWLLAAGPVLAECSREGVDSASTVVALELSLGEICIELFDTAAPKTVENFLDYLDRGEIDDTFIHRSVPGFVIQGGGYREVGGVHESVPARADVVLNEPCALDTPVSEGSETLVCSTRGNQRGTLSLAKLGSDPNSGTTNWFINLADNRVNLDNANGGFTVFGRVLGEGMEVVDAIAALPLASVEELFWRDSELEGSLAGSATSQTPLPLLSPPSLAGAEAGCFTANAPAVVVELLPVGLSISPDPVTGAFSFRISHGCGTRVAPEAFVAVSPGPGCVYGSLLAVDISGYSNGSLAGEVEVDPETQEEEFVFYSFDCEQAEEVVSLRDWRPAYEATFDEELVTISSATRVPEPCCGLTGPTAFLALAGLRRSRRYRA